MSMEGPRNFVRNLKEDVKDKIDDVKFDIQARKEAKIVERLASVGLEEWSNGPVRITVEPISWMYDFLKPEDIEKLGSFKATYPQLEKPLGKERHEEISPLVIGRIDIGSGKETEAGVTQNYMQEGKLVVSAGVELLADVQQALKDIANEIKQNKKPLSDIDYIMGVSRLGSVAGHLGFDTYALPDDGERNHPSHQLAEKSNIMGGMDPEKAAKQARKRALTLAVISKKKLLELYGS